MSEIQNDKSRQAQELRELQESYRKRKQSIEEEGEADLNRVRQENREQIQKESRTGAAVVSHVR
ncbi:MAG: hypothetical protein HC883_04105, partial [Bdellovibrionaceae bacterium]|nr:hypothetical protein [Pseudobdellovibrionaceae bacterium]